MPSLRLRNQFREQSHLLPLQQGQGSKRGCGQRAERRPRRRLTRVRNFDHLLTLSNKTHAFVVFQSGLEILTTF